jgi:hypothetical protein
MPWASASRARLAFVSEFTPDQALWRVFSCATSNGYKALARAAEPAHVLQRHGHLQNAGAELRAADKTLHHGVQVLRLGAEEAHR